MFYLVSKLRWRLGGARTLSFLSSSSLTHNPIHVFRLASFWKYVGMEMGGVGSFGSLGGFSNFWLFRPLNLI